MRSAGAAIGPGSSPPRAIFFLLQPLLLVLVFAAGCVAGATPGLSAGVLLCAQLSLGLAEWRWPARRDWVQRPAEKVLCGALFVLFTAAAGGVTLLYEAKLAPSLALTRQALGLQLWPQGWPLAARVLLAFLASELLWYGLHRSEHRFAPIWRASGHGVHHSFKRLNALNFNANHPIEAAVICLPAVLVAFLLGAGEEARVAQLLVMVNASCVHANVRMNSHWIGAVFTTNALHFRHHSAVLEESNTNYGCASIVWDRLFGTFAEGEPREAGVGPVEPGFGAKLLMPLREAEQVAIAP